MTDELYNLPTDWEEAKQAIRQAMAEEHSCVDRLLEAAEQSRTISGGELSEVLEHTLELVDSGLPGTELFLASARLGPVSYDLFRQFPAAWDRCTEAAAGSPHNFGVGSRILHEDLLYNYYLKALRGRLTDAGFGAFIQSLRETRFLRDDEMGRRVGQNAVLSILRENRVTDSAQLEELGRECAEMPALQRKLRKLLGQAS